MFLSPDLPTAMPRIAEASLCTARNHRWPISPVSGLLQCQFLQQLVSWLCQSGRSSLLGLCLLRWGSCLLSRAMSVGVTCQLGSKEVTDVVVILPDLISPKGKEAKTTGGPQHNIVLLEWFLVQRDFDSPQNVWCNWQTWVVYSRFRLFQALSNFNCTSCMALWASSIAGVWPSSWRWVGFCSGSVTIVGWYTDFPLSSSWIGLTRAVAHVLDCPLILVWPLPLSTPCQKLAGHSGVNGL